MHHFRYWHSFPATPTPSERGRASRLVAVSLVIGEVLLVAAIVTLFVLVLDLRASRLHQAKEQQQAIDATFCNVLAELPAASPELQRIRHDLHCTQPGLSPDELRRLTGGSP